MVSLDLAIGLRSVGPSELVDSGPQSGVEVLASVAGPIVGERPVDRLDAVSSEEVDGPLPETVAVTDFSSASSSV